MISPAPVSTSVNLKKVGKCWSFDSEIALEDFLWKNLFYLLDLVPFKRQFSIDGQVCDILALNYDNQLSILELKNTEDRYVVNQLTRYYAALIEQKPFHEQIDYSKPVRLIAVAPKFHKDNYSDQKYSLLDIELIRFELSQVDSCVFFEIEHEEYREKFVERYRYLRLDPHYKSGLALPIIEYMKLLGESESLDSFENLINLSLKTWLERLK
jgi:hypothetical protein